MQHNQIPLQQSFFFSNPDERKQEFMEQMFSLVAILATETCSCFIKKKNTWLMPAL